MHKIGRWRRTINFGQAPRRAWICRQPSPPSRCFAVALEQSAEPRPTADIGEPDRFPLICAGLNIGPAAVRRPQEQPRPWCGCSESNGTSGISSPRAAARDGNGMDFARTGEMIAIREIAIHSLRGAVAGFLATAPMSTSSPRTTATDSAITAVNHSTS
jgi:hypothetical protein